VDFISMLQIVSKRYKLSVKGLSSKYSLNYISISLGIGNIVVEY
jgi:hypothetical protein